MTLPRSPSSRASALVRRIGARCSTELVRVTQASWFGVKRLLESQDLTYASSIAYYALLSLFPVPAPGLLPPRLRGVGRS